MIWAAIIVIAWAVLSLVACWFAGRFIRVGMVELQPGRKEDQP